MILVSMERNKLPIRVRSFLCIFTWARFFLSKTQIKTSAESSFWEAVKKSIQLSIPIYRLSLDRASKSQKYYMEK
jgi:hypothetical protein